MSDMAISFTVLAGVVVLFVWNRLPVEVVAIGAALTLYANGVLEQDDPDVLAVDDPAAMRRQAVPPGAGARRAMAILGAMVVALATGVIPAVVVGLLAAMALVVTRVLTIDQAYHAINWTTVVLMGINVAAAAALLTPVATPVNLMIMRPAGYRFGDYWKLGLPLMVWFFVISVFLVPVFWSF